MLLTEPPLNPRRNRERMAELMFETFQAPALYLKVQAALALMASGRVTGCALDSGDGVSHAVPVYEGYVVEHAVQRLDLAGRDVTRFLRRLLTERGAQLQETSAEFEIVRGIKEATAFVALDFQQQLRPTVSSITGGGASSGTAGVAGDVAMYQLPDGQEVALGSERFRCAEILFQPLLAGREAAGLHECVNRAVKAADVDLRAELLGNVVLSGGTTLLRGLQQRLLKELRVLTGCNNGSYTGGCGGGPARVHVVAAPDRQFQVWTGGSILASSDAMLDMWVTSEEYAECGVGVMHSKCV